MEGVTFHTPQLAGLLRKGFVEARLHMDRPGAIDPAKFKVHERLRAELIGSTGTPYYAIIDPDDGEFLLRTHLHGGDPGQWTKDFVALLDKLPAKNH